VAGQAAGNPTLRIMVASLRALAVRAAGDSHGVVATDAAISACTCWTSVVA